ncbi:hypothetical protein GQR58_015853 [Nymphon striatum]|nr:hypothetical protein GQR58_015853 [Nymphon striatum]
MPYRVCFIKSPLSSVEIEWKTLQILGRPIEKHQQTDIRLNEAAGQTSPSRWLQKASPYRTMGQMSPFLVFTLGRRYNKGKHFADPQASNGNRSTDRQTFSNIIV